MLFNSIQFIIFFAIVLLIYWRLNRRGQNVFLLLASAAFYGAWDWRYLALIGISIVSAYFAGLHVAKDTPPRARKSILVGCLVINFGILGVYKYFDFFVDGMVELLNCVGVGASTPTLNLLLPIGISFYTFQAMSYVVDVHRGKVAPSHSLPTFALYVAFFPQLVAGPIERASHLLPQFLKERQLTTKMVGDALWLLLVGYYMKVFAADNLALIADRAYALPHADDAWGVVAGTYAFALQIFGDFAGYSCIAVGAAQLLGFDLMHNFRSPYCATSPRDFWRHWHISLSQWLRDYLYIPLGGSRHGTWFTRRNLLITMALGGLWHGAGWGFVLWGVYHGVLLVIQHAWEGSRTEAGPGEPSRVFKAFSIFATFHLVAFGWILFRSQSMAQVVSMISALFDGWKAPSVTQTADLINVLFFGLPLLWLQAIRKDRFKPYTSDHHGVRTRWLAAVVMVFSLFAWGEYGGQDFVYFQF